MSFRAHLVEYFRQRDRGWLLSLLAVVCLVYLPFLGNQFVFDDINFFSGAMLEHYQHAPFNLELRWFPYASLGLTAAIFSDALPHFFHLGNALLHAANVILLFYFLRQLLDALALQPEHGRNIIRGAWFAALLFAVHPVAVYAVGYVIQRSILLATFFALVMQMAYLRALLTGRVRWLLLAVLAYFMAGFSKEHSVLLPAVLLALHGLVQSGTQPSAVKLSNPALGLCWGAFAVIGVTLVLLARGGGGAYEPMAVALFEQQELVASTPLLHLLSALTQAGLFFKYLLLWFLPVPAWMSVDMREPFISSLSDWRGWAGGLAFIAYGALAIRLLLGGGIKGVVGFALLSPWLQFIVELAVIRVQEPFVLYRSYLWMPGILLLIPLLLIRFPGRGTKLAFALAVILLMPLAWNRLMVFGDNYRLWNDAALLLKNEKLPGADRIYYNRGLALLSMQEWEAAARDFERAVEISPQLQPIRYYLGIAYGNSGRLNEALVQFDAAIAISANDNRAYFAKGMALKQLHRNEEARLQFAQSCKLNNPWGCLYASAPKHK